MNNLEIKKNDWGLKINLDGGRIEELRYKDEIILGTYQRIDGKNRKYSYLYSKFWR